MFKCCPPCPQFYGFHCTIENVCLCPYLVSCERSGAKCFIKVCERTPVFQHGVTNNIGLEKRAGICIKRNNLIVWFFSRQAVTFNHNLTNQT